MAFKRTVSAEVRLKESDKIFTISDLRMSFSVSKTFSPTANICDLKIYNLSEYTRGRFHEIGDQITLNVGYESEEGEQILFIANTQRVYHQFALPEIVTSLECLDAELFILTGPIKGSYSNEVSALQVLRDIATQMELRGINIPNNVVDKSYKNGHSYCDSANKCLSVVCDYLGLNWSIQNKILQLAYKGQSVDEPPILLSAETGLIYYPEILKDLPVQVDPLTNQRLVGWRVRSLLNPRIKPRAKVQIYSNKVPQLNGIYRVDSVRHVGDTHANQWETVADLVPS